jgi:hypothetical protein
VAEAPNAIAGRVSARNSSAGNAPDGGCLLAVIELSLGSKASEALEVSERSDPFCTTVLTAEEYDRAVTRLWENGVFPADGLGINPGDPEVTEVHNIIRRQRGCRTDGLARVQPRPVGPLQGHVGYAPRCEALARLLR